MQNNARKTIKTEAIVQEIPNQLLTWRGRHMSSLINILRPDLQGEMPFPMAPSKKSENIKDMQQGV